MYNILLFSGLPPRLALMVMASDINLIFKNFTFFSTRNYNVKILEVKIELLLLLLLRVHDFECDSSRVRNYLYYCRFHWYCHC